ncbi:MAG: toxin-antitoxin system YwqK family antitoxin [Bacteroidia bacterium]|nr:toxin-antitoxin system YwqK family antitoxin [Bacteroidia bacterium]
MRKTLLIVLFVAGKVGLAQSFEVIGKDTINFVDENNLRQGFWVILNKVKKLPGYKEDSKVEEGAFKDSKKSGMWKQFFASGKIKNEITYANNRPNGYARMYFENGNIMEEGMWDNNRWVGTYKQYYESGKVYYDWNYNNQGKREGEQKYYYESGKTMIEGNWKEGKENGSVKEYYENGTLKAERVFNDGSIDIAASKEYAETGAAHALDGVALPAATKGTTKTATTVKIETVKETAKPVTETKTTSATETTTSNVTQPQKHTIVSNDLGIVSDGYNKLYNSKKQVDKEGVFKGGKLWDGFQLEYSGVDVVKVKVYKDGKISETLTKKEDIEKVLKK